MCDDTAIFAMVAEDKKTAVDAANRARAITALHDEFGHSYPRIAERLGITIAQLQAGRNGRETDSRPRRAPRRDTGRAAAPRITPTTVHGLCTRWEAGNLDAATLVEQPRELLGGWEPATPTRTETPRQKPANRPQ